MDILNKNLDSVFFRKSGNVFDFFVFFIFGLVFSPFQNGSKLFLFFLLVNFILSIYITKLDMNYWTPEKALTYLCGSLLGFIIGRTVAGYKDPFSNELTQEKKEELEKKILFRNLN